MKRAKWYLPLLLVSMLLFAGGACGPPELPIIPPTLPEPVTEPPQVPTPAPTPAPTPPTPYSTVSIPIEEFPNHPHIDVVMHAVVGEDLTVTLGSNPTTGFQWLEDAKISNGSVIKQVSHKFVGPGIDKPPGTPGEEVWTFKALKKGRSTINLEYSRSWEEKDAEWTVTITVNIN